MKIGILTFANVANFGANLQALSTVCYLRNLGHEAFVINWCPDDFNQKFQQFTTLQQRAHEVFFLNNICHTRVVKTDEEIANLLDEEEFNAVIVGSDAVLQHFSFLSRFHFPTRTIYRIDQITSDRIFPNAFWGSFIKYLKSDIKIAIMSGSSQNCKYKNISRSDRKQMADALKHFCYISVRDKWTWKMIQYVSNGNVCPQITPDPVFAFNQNCPQNVTKEEIVSKFNLPFNYVLFSFKKKENIDYDWLCRIKKLFKEKGFECVAFPMPDGIVFKHPFDYEVKPPLSPLDWYNLIRHSNGYIGENMHPVVVCLHNATPVFSFDAYGARRFSFFIDDFSSKVYDIMSVFNLSSNRVRVKTYVSEEYVVDKIVNFDKIACKKIADSRLALYNKMMKKILLSFES